MNQRATLLYVIKDDGPVNELRLTELKPSDQKLFKFVSIIMPVFNGESYIDESVKAVTAFMRRLRYPFEVVVVDDGSEDGTREKALRLASRIPNVKVVGYNRNRGKGAAFLYGYKNSEGDVIVLFDSDLDIPPQQIQILLGVMRRRNADLVITNKWHPLSRTRATMLRKILSRGYNLMVRLITGLYLEDTQTGAKAIRRYVLDAIVPKMYVKRYAFDVELLLLAIKSGFKVAEAPSVKPINLSAPFRPKNIMGMLLELLSIAYRHGRL